MPGAAAALSFAVLVPNSSAFGISKRLGDNERRRLRRIIDEVKPAGHGLIVRTAAEGASADELQRDVTSLVEQWNAIETEAKKSDQPGLLYREPELSVRILRVISSPSVLIVPTPSGSTFSVTRVCESRWSSSIMASLKP